MTKKGYKEKFIKIFLFFSILVCYFFLYMKGEPSIELVIVAYIYAAIYSLIPAAIVALIWEFFDEAPQK